MDRCPLQALWMLLSNPRQCERLPGRECQQAVSQSEICSSLTLLQSIQAENRKQLIVYTTCVGPPFSHCDKTAAGRRCARRSPRLRISCIGTALSVPPPSWVEPHYYWHGRPWH